MLLLSATFASCGFRNDQQPVCGDGEVTGNEQCDNGDAGANATCDSTCRFTCGNGAVDSQFGEQCDPGIASGDGACPAACDDQQQCTTDILQHPQTCQATCSHALITTAITGDGCCPAGANATTDSDCTAACGNGVVEAGERCDPGIASGPGACPVACNDDNTCTSDTLVEAGSCQARCVATPITAPINNDSCCPAGANGTTDTDCTAVCDNGVVEPGERCDIGIASGAGACPTTCADTNACTTDALVAGGTCQARCTFTEITQPTNSDGCCPSTANANNDNDCAPVCGNGVVEMGEVCDKSIASGPGACPTTCDDANTCTRDTLNNPNTCTASCTHTTITTATNGDMCCPAGANANTDSDCAPVCGNGVIESGETCDDSNTIATDFCDAACQLHVPTEAAIRFSDMDLRDPHTFVNFLGCRDVTDSAALGFSFNGSLQKAIQTDGNDPDTNLDVSFLLRFRNFTTASGATQQLELHYPDCSAPMAATSCKANGVAPVTFTATNTPVNPCLSVLAGTTKPYSPAVSTPSQVCFTTNATSLPLGVLGAPVVLRNARIAATYNADGTLSNGLLMGFLSETEADAITLDPGLVGVGGQPLSSLLPGGTGNCAPHSDKDNLMGTQGWWFYYNFTAQSVPWTE